MPLPAFTPSITDEMHGRIDDALSQIESREAVRFLFAIESGSRAWGFPSPDSDYDVRFVYARPLDWYLTLAPGRDVIELPIDGDLDINGWDIRKALDLLMKPNPVLLEWLSSPIRYRWDASVCAPMRALAAKVTHGPACLHHYLHLGAEQRRRHLGDRSSVNYKKYFYVLRPALALMWLRDRPESAPPMNLQDLVGGLDLRAAEVEAIARLLTLKAQTRETGDGPRIAVIDALIERSFCWAETAQPPAAPQRLREDADALFRAVVKT